eukprot:gnl/TRDRNA2_/TRDRNA2_170640_c0_seq2.p1 gnl/TRDRNA2_/TRDRNA2_170640_c0~~gnl/TRDRNA2_/TRDRNA2_170640_c0_seq2.p1  ORF type:complete len:471 (-),score=41.94 gnl/TRDRNA2_/TRDRNA2_170640_c0_seq2:214-1626(-)
MIWSISGLRTYLYGTLGSAPISRLLEILKVIPMDDFSEAASPASFDYEKLESWSAHPARKRGRALEDANHLFLPGDEAASVPVETRPADCFYVHDSTLTPAEILSFRDAGGDCRDLWNMPAFAPEGSALAQLVEKINECVDLRVAIAASCFNKSCRIYAPRYRQVNVMGLLHLASPSGVLSPLGRVLPRNAEEAMRSFDLAYKDVRLAFIHFVDDPANALRPFFLAGHSQGTCHISRLLVEEVENHPSRLRRLVHAYLPGMCIPRDLFEGRLKHISASTSPSDLRSVSSWRTCGPKHVDLLRRGLGIIRHSAEAGFSFTPHGSPLVVNPITWSSKRGGPFSDPALHKGAVFPMHMSNFGSAQILDHRAYIGGSGTHLRLGKLTMRLPGALGLRIPLLSRVECGSISANLDKQDGALQLAHDFPAGSLFELCQGGFLLWHDLDFCLFYGNIRDNVGLRLQMWQRQHTRNKL